MTVVAFVLDHEARARLRRGLDGLAEVQFCERADDLAGLVREASPSLLVVEPRNAAGRTMSAVIRALREDFPSLPIVAFCRLSYEEARELIHLARAGVDELIWREHDDIGVTARRLLVRSAANRAASEALQSLVPLVPSTVRPILAYCLERSRDTLRVEDIATGVGVHRRTLVNRLAAAGLPAPGALAAWCRLLVASRLLEEPGRSVDQVAGMLKFGSGAALRAMLKRHTGLRPDDVRRQGGFACLLRLLRDKIEVARQRVA